MPGHPTGSTNVQTTGTRSDTGLLTYTPLYPGNTVEKRGEARDDLLVAPPGGETGTSRRRRAVWRGLNQVH